MGPRNAIHSWQLVQSGSDIRTVARPEHRVQFYKDDHFLAKAVAEHLSVALRSGGAGLLLSTPLHRQLILEELGRLELPADVVLKNCVAVDALEVLDRFMVNGQPDPVKFKTVIRELIQRARTPQLAENQIAAYGELVSVLVSQGKREAALQVEQLWDHFCRVYPLSLLCGYSLSSFSRDNDCELFANICSKHSGVVPAESFMSPISEDVQAREIAELQQRAEALDLEVQARKNAESELRTTREQLESTVEQRTQALRQLSLQVLKLQDMERRRIARELHDSLGQDFVGLKVNLRLARQSPDREEVWEQCEHLLEHCIREVRTLSYLLHPPLIEDAGVAHAAEWYIRDFSRRTSIAVSFVAADDIGSLPDNVQLVLFRVLQESLMNVYRHARASSCDVCLSRENQKIMLEVHDNGKGIAADRATRFDRSGAGMGVGLTGVWERVRDVGGETRLTSGSRGTSLRISVPLPDPR